MQNKVYLADNLDVLKQLDSESVDLIYIDPPFNTGSLQSYSRKTFVQNDSFQRKGFGNKTYQVLSESETISYSDSMPVDVYYDFLTERLLEAKRLLKPTGSLYFHIDYREVHYCKVLLDQIFDRQNFLNEIIWAYDYGARTKRKWPTKHDNILFYAKDYENYYFDIDACDRIEYMSPKLVGEEKAALGKTPTDCFWMSIIGTNAKERIGYPTQKPIKLIERFVNTSCPRNGVVLDFFAGSGTTGEVALRNNRNFILVDNSIDAFEIMKLRLSAISKNVLFVDSYNHNVYAPEYN